MRTALLLFLVALPLSCGSPRVSWKSSWDDNYADFSTGQRAAFEGARSDLEEGRLEPAREGLSALFEAAPDNLEVGTWLQDVELLLLEGESPANPDLFAALEAAPAPAEALRSLYEERARSAPSVAGYVLAARAEPDAIAAVRLLESALELDPGCAWAYYGKAHALLRDRHLPDRWAKARDSLAMALTLDPSHLHARRLEAWMFAQEGDIGAAGRALEVWLDQTAGDPRVAIAARCTAQVDLAIALVQQGQSGRAVDLLRGLEGQPHDRGRRLAILAVALQEVGEIELALDSARRAEKADPGSLLPVVQQALLLQHDLEDSAAAQERWEVVAASGGGSLAAMMQVLRGRVELERSAEGD